MNRVKAGSIVISTLTGFMSNRISIEQSTNEEYIVRIGANFEPSRCRHSPLDLPFLNGRLNRHCEFNLTQWLSQLGRQRRINMASAV